MENFGHLKNFQNLHKIKELEKFLKFSIFVKFVKFWKISKVFKICKILEISKNFKNSTKLWKFEVNKNFLLIPISFAKLSSKTWKIRQNCELSNKSFENVMKNFKKYREIKKMLMLKIVKNSDF